MMTARVRMVGLVTLLVALWASALGGTGLADGGLLIGERWLEDFTEQSQLAVVEVRPDSTAKIDLCISLSDTSDESREVHFLLPLQTLPDEFTAQEIPVSHFRDERLQPLEDLARKWVAERNSHQGRIGAAFKVASLIAGPCASVWTVFGYGGHRGIMGGVQGGLGGMRGALAHEGVVQPALTVETEHSRADVYDALDTAALAGLAGVPKLPRAVVDALSSYAGRPFALVKLTTIPLPEGSEGRSLDRLREYGTDDEFGLVFTFTQQMVEREGARCYDYPLGTGGAWVHPIPVTRVYVIAPDDLAVEVEFPGKEKRSPTFGPKDGFYLGSDARAWAAEGQQVHAAMYLDENPTEDVAVRLRDGGDNEFAVERRKRPRQLLLAVFGFGVLGCTAWLLPFGLAVWPDPRARQLGLRRALGRSWLLAYGVLLVPALLVRVSASGRTLQQIAGLWYLSSIVPDLTDMASFWVLVASCLIALGALVVYLARRLPKPSQFVARTILAAIAAAIIYMSVGTVVLRRFTS